ncbi:MAG: hypothetical protein ACM3SR_11960 [Ignavibacteriales bacterium]
MDVCKQTKRIALVTISAMIAHNQPSRKKFSLSKAYNIELILRRG